MTEEELRIEMRHVMETRLAILCGAEEATAKQIVMAIEEAEAHCNELRTE